MDDQVMLLTRLASLVCTTVMLTLTVLFGAYLQVNHSRHGGTVLFCMTLGLVASTVACTNLVQVVQHMALEGPFNALELLSCTAVASAWVLVTLGAASFGCLVGAMTPHSVGGAPAPSLLYCLMGLLIVTGLVQVVMQLPLVGGHCDWPCTHWPLQACRWLWLGAGSAVLGAQLMLATWLQERSRPKVNENESLVQPLLISRDSGVGEGPRAAVLSQGARPLGKLFFSWVHPLMKLGASKPLEQSDLFVLPPKLHAGPCCQKLWRAWDKQTMTPNKHNKMFHNLRTQPPAADEPSQPHVPWVVRGPTSTPDAAQTLKPTVLRMLWGVHGRTYLRIGALKLVNNVLNFAGPVLLNRLVRYMTSSPGSAAGNVLLGGPGKGRPGALWALWDPSSVLYGTGLVALLTATLVVKALLSARINWMQGIMCKQLEAGISAMVFKKVLLLNSSTMSRISSGAVQTLMAVDTGRIVNLVGSLHDLWGLPLQIAIALWLLYTQVRYAFIAGLVVVIALIPVNRVLASRIQTASQQLMAAKDERIKVMSELLSGIQSIKLACWEGVFARRVMQHRRTEVQALSVRKYLDALCVYFWAATSLLFSLFTFGLFALMGHDLTPEVAFTSLALFNVLIAPLNSFPWVINGVVEALVSCKRLQSFMRLANTQDRWLMAEAPPPSQGGWSSKGDSSSYAAPPSSRVSDFPSVHTVVSIDAAGIENIVNEAVDKTDVVDKVESVPRGSSGHVSGLPDRHGNGAASAADGMTDRDTAIAADKPSHASAALAVDGLTDGTNSQRADRRTDLPISVPPWHQGVDCPPDLPVSTRSSSFAQPGETSVHVAAPSSAGSADGPRSASSTGLSSLTQALSCSRSGSVSHSFTAPSTAAVPHDLRVAGGRGGFEGRNTGDASVNAAPYHQNPSGDQTWHQDDADRQLPSAFAARGTVQQQSTPDTGAEVADGGTPGMAPGASSTAAAVIEDTAVSGEPSDGSGAPLSGPPYAVVVKNASWDYAAVSVLRDPSLCLLRRVSFKIPKGGLMAITGELGSGKSSLLLGLMGELIQVEGTVEVAGSTAYVQQQPWVMTGTIRDNVLFGSPFDREWYRDVVFASGLASDLADMPHGSDTRVGDKGCTLSGGQRMRLTLARALYQNCDVYIMDDILSCLDAHVAAHVFHHAICGLLRGRTRLLVGHYGPAVRQADLLLTLHAGQMQYLGPPRDGLRDIEDELRLAERRIAHRVSIKHATQDGHHVDSIDGVEDDARGEERVTGHVRLSVWLEYARAVGTGVTSLVFISLIAMQASRNANDLWLSYWVAHMTPTDALATAKSYLQRFPLVPCRTDAMTDIGLAAHSCLPLINNSSSVLAGDTAASLSTDLMRSTGPSRDVVFYLKILLYIAIANSILTLVRAFAFAYAGMAAARRLQRKLLSAVLAAPMLFFEITPCGRVLNRFSSDTSTIDDSLPFTLNIMLANLAGIAGMLIVLCAVAPPLTLLLLPLGVAYRQLQVFYRCTSREIRRLESLARSPVYQTFKETVEGGPVIRASTKQLQFAALNESQVCRTVRASISGLSASLWLGLRLELLACTLVAALGALAVASRHGLGHQMSAGLLGLCLSYALPITGLLNGLLTSSAETEQELVAVERVTQYMIVPPQAQLLPPFSGQGHLGGLHAGASLQAGPRALIGQIVFSDVRLVYPSTGRTALNGISFTVHPGEKMAVCGRTGAGKSSIVAALTRLHDISGGNITVHGIDVAAMRLRDLRKGVGVVTQVPFLFEGSVRDNLDPEGLYSDGDLVATLKMVGMWEVLAAVFLSRKKAGHDPHVPLEFEPSGTPPGTPPARTQYHDPFTQPLPTPPAHTHAEGSATGTGDGVPATKGPLGVPPVGSAPHHHVGGGVPGSPRPGSYHNPPGRPPLFPKPPGTPSRGLQQPSSWSPAPRVPGPSAKAPVQAIRTPAPHGSSSASPEAGLTGAAGQGPAGRGQGARHGPPPPGGPHQTHQMPTAQMERSGFSVSQITSPVPVVQGDEHSGTAAHQAAPQHQAGSNLFGYIAGHVEATAGGTVGATSKAAVPISSTHERDQRDRNRVYGRRTIPTGPGTGPALLAMTLGEAGAGLSQGQKQLLCVARVLLKRPGILVLDECTAHVDPVTATWLHQVLTTYQSVQGCSYLQIAHQLPHVMDHDIVMVMEAGQIIESGMPAALANDPNSALYAMLHTAAYP